VLRREYLTGNDMHLEKQHCLCKVEEEGNNNVS
jgi:hypothetical protein